MKQKTQFNRGDIQFFNAQTILRLAGHDATPEEYGPLKQQLFGDGEPFAQGTWKSAQDKVTNNGVQVPQFKNDCAQGMLRHVQGLPDGFELIADSLLGTTEGRSALRKSMSRLNFKSLRKLFGIEPDVSD